MISILHFICTSPCLCLLLVKHGCIWLWGNILNIKRKEKIYISQTKSLESLRFEIRQNYLNRTF